MTTAQIRQSEIDRICGETLAELRDEESVAADETDRIIRSRIGSYVDDDFEIPRRFFNEWEAQQ